MAAPGFPVQGAGQGMFPRGPQFVGGGVARLPPTAMHRTGVSPPPQLMFASTGPAERTNSRPGPASGAMTERTNSRATPAAPAPATMLVQPRNDSRGLSNGCAVGANRQSSVAPVAPQNVGYVAIGQGPSGALSASLNGRRQAQVPGQTFHGTPLQQRRASVAAPAAAGVAAGVSAAGVRPSFGAAPGSPQLFSATPQAGSSASGAAMTRILPRTAVSPGPHGHGNLSLGATMPSLFVVGSSAREPSLSSTCCCGSARQASPSHSLPTVDRSIGHRPIGTSSPSAASAQTAMAAVPPGLGPHHFVQRARGAMSAAPAAMRVALALSSAKAGATAPGVSAGAPSSSKFQRACSPAAQGTTQYSLAVGLASPAIVSRAALAATNGATVAGAYRVHVRATSSGAGVARLEAGAGPILLDTRCAKDKDKAVADIIASMGDIMPAPRENGITKFFHEALRGSASAAALALQPRMDVSAYWEKRRIQSLMRRLLETLQERFGVESDAAASELAAVFDVLLTAETVGGDAASLALDEEHFCRALDAAEGWPLELVASDRSEIFSALLVPSLAAARAVLNAEQSLGASIVSRDFCEGLERVPFNLPDFPVPDHTLHLANTLSAEAYTVEQTDAVASAIATTFCMDSTGLDKVKDFFLSGLLALEEIQRALPRLVPCGLVEDAVTQIICRGAPLFSPDDWENLVASVRRQQAESGDAAAGAPTCFVDGGDDPASQSTTAPIAEEGLPQLGEPLDAHVCLASPPVQHRDIDVSAPPPASAPAAAPCVGVAADGFFSEAAPSEAHRFRGRAEPVTEPLPTRELRSEDPVCFLHGASTECPALLAAAVPRPLPLHDGAAAMATRSAVGADIGSADAARVVDWTTATTSGRLGAIQLGEGGGGIMSSGAAGGLAGDSKDQAGPVDHLAWINLDLHHECGGPYLARAFVLACQLYERRRLQSGSR